MKYRTRRGDMLDAVCFEYYKGRPQAVEAVMDANPGLAKVGPILPEGLVIDLPDLPPPEDHSTISLWD